MVKKSKKSKSKRVPLRKKYKILRKVKEHHKKKAKEAKKQVGKKKKVEKDPGIPNAWPFKEQELQALEERRARALKELEEKKLAKKLRAKERAELRKRNAPEENELDGLVRDTEARTTQFEDAARSKASRSSQRHAQDGSKRSFYKELLKVIEASDVVVEVLDARDPLGTRCPDMEKLVFKSQQTPKRLILLLNKIDLVPKEIAEKWLKYLREELPTIAFKCNTQMQRSNRSRRKSKSKEIIETSSDCLGADTLLQLLKNYSRSEDLKRAITVGIVGLPNVGKSSLINSLKRSRAVSTGATPGLTRTMQEVQLDKHVKLLDCPGVVLAESKDLIDLRNCTKIEKLVDPISPVKEILRKCGHEKLMSFYKIPSFNTVDEFLQLVATIRGKFKKGGVVDTETAAKIVLYEWNEGKISHYTVPPVRESAGPSESAIVASWGKEFNLDEVFKKEQSTVIAGLPSLSDTDYTELPASAPLSMDVKMMENSDDEAQKDDEAKQVEEVAPQPQAMDTSEQSAKKEKKSVQTEKLYDEEGIFNPRLAKAEKRRRKKSAKEATAGEAMEGTYDFDVDYVVDGDPVPSKKQKQKQRAR